MKSRKKIFFIIAGIVLIALTFLVYSRVKSNMDASNKQIQIIPTVELTQPKRTNLINKLNFTGDILAKEQANIYSRVSGNIQRIYVDIGDYVRQGKLLAEIDRAIYLQNVRQTEGLFKQAKATVENNQVNYQRTNDLYEKGLLSKAELDNARTTLTVSEAQVESALANYRNAQTQLSYCSITAPFSGYITKRLLDRGSYVSVGGSAQSSTIFTLSDINIVKVMVNVLEKDVPVLDKVQQAHVTSSVYPNEVFNAEVKKMSQSVDLATRTMPVEIDIENKEGKLKPGMFTSTELILSQENNAMILPSQCVIKDDKGTYVYQVNFKDSSAFKKYIQIGLQQDNNDQVTSGLADEDKVVLTGQTLLKEGSKVKITK